MTCYWKVVMLRQVKMTCKCHVTRQQHKSLGRCLNTRSAWISPWGDRWRWEVKTVGSEESDWKAREDESHCQSGISKVLAVSMLSSGSVSKAAWTISQEQMVLRLSPAVPPPPHPPPPAALPPFPPFLPGWCHGKREHFLSAGVGVPHSLSVSSESRRPSGHWFAAVMWPLRPNQM